jgi:hypothetical protein
LSKPEERDVETVDLPGAFLQADMDQLIQMMFEGEIAKIIVKPDPKLYQEYVVMEGNRTVL